MRLVTAAVLAAIVATLGLVVIAMARHPAVLRDPAAPVYLVSFALVWPSCAVAAVLAARRQAAIGLLFAAVVGALWVIG